MSNPKQWLSMVKSGESLTVEFKRQAPKLERLSKSFSAFSNSAGGVMFFGVEDDGEIVGLAHLDGTQDLVSQVADFHCDPSIEPQFDIWRYAPGVDVLVVTIEEAEQKPVYAVNPNNERDAWPFFRSDKENLPLDKRSIKTMSRGFAAEVDDGLKDLDKHAVLILNKLSDKPRQTLNQLAKSANISAHRAKKIMVELERNGWIHGFFNEKRREFSLTIPWKKR